MGAIISGIIAVAKAIPVVDSWLQKLSAAYLQYRINSMKQENVDAIRKALKDYDQRALENAIGSPTAGQASGDAGAVITNSPPPGVPKP